MQDEKTDMEQEKSNKNSHYVDNRKFTEAMTEWATVARSKPKNERPPLPPFVGECLMKLVTGYARKVNFSGYTYVDEMRSEALLTCVKYAHNFDPEKSQNAFAYFTQIIHHAFTQVLNKEKNISTMKFNMMKDANPSLSKRDFNEIMLGDSESE